MTPAVPDEKARIRDLVRATRCERTERAGGAPARDEMQRAESGVNEQLRALIARLGVSAVSCFASTAREPGTRSFIRWACATGIDLILPVSRPDGLLEWVRPAGDEYAAGAFGIDEPVGERLPPEALASVDLIIAPACAVDTRGVRLGWGRGYFDRTIGELATRPPLAVVVWDDEIFASLPREKHDVPADYLVTPTRTLEI